MVRGITRRATSIRRFTAAALGLGTLALTSSALAEPRTHDGFYMHIDAGLGYYSTNVSDAKLKYSGMTFPSSIFFGGSPVPGLAIAGGFFVDYAPSPTIKQNDVDTNADVKQYLVGIGPLVDFYINPNEGLHFQAFIGYGGLETSDSRGNVGGSDPIGLVTFIGGGYDWWVGDEWSIGVMARFTYAPLNYEVVGGGQSVSAPTIAPALLATFTYH